MLVIAEDLKVRRVGVGELVTRSVGESYAVRRCGLASATQWKKGLKAAAGRKRRKARL